MARAWRKKGQINRWLTALENHKKYLGPNPPKTISGKRLRQVEGEIAILERKLEEAGVNIVGPVVIK